MQEHASRTCDSLALMCWEARCTCVLMCSHVRARPEDVWTWLCTRVPPEPQGRTVRPLTPLTFDLRRQLGGARRGLKVTATSLDELLPSCRTNYLAHLAGGRFSSLHHKIILALLSRESGGLAPGSGDCACLDCCGMGTEGKHASSLVHWLCIEGNSWLLIQKCVWVL